MPLPIPMRTINIQKSKRIKEKERKAASDETFAKNENKKTIFFCTKCRYPKTHEEKCLFFMLCVCLTRMIYMLFVPKISQTAAKRQPTMTTTEKACINQMMPGQPSKNTNLPRRKESICLSAPAPNKWNGIVAKKLLQFEKVFPLNFRY